MPAIETLRRSYATSLRSAEEHNLPLQSFTTNCCNQVVLLVQVAAPERVRLLCPHCGAATTARAAAGA